MSNPPPQAVETEAHANDANAQPKTESLESKLETMHLTDPESSTESQEPRRKKPCGRDLLKRLNRRRLKVTRINFTISGNQAGKGSHGEVVVATLSSDDGASLESANQIAVKKFLFGDNVDEEKFLRTFANELHVLDGLDHPNIIKLVGFVEDIGNCIAWLVFPWEANGNVREFLLSGKWELPERVSLIKDVARGLEYLHTRQPPVRHGDLKSLNILVNSDHRAVITDFGSARIQTEARGFETTSSLPRRQTLPINPNLTEDDTGCPEVTVTMANAQLTLTGPSWSFRWAAPEILNEEEPCLASDVWALGWIAWEIVTDNYPFPEAKTNKLITVKIIKGLLPSLYNDDQLSQIGRLCDIMARCWKPEAGERLSVAECRSHLQWVPSSIPRTKSDGASSIRSAALLLEMSEVRRLQSKYKEALKLCDEAYAIAQSAGDEQTMARALYVSVNSHRMLYNNDQAEKACNESLAIYTRIGYSLGEADALFSLGEVHQSRGNLAKAEESFTKALAGYTSINQSLGRGNVFWRLGQTYEAQSNYAQSEESFNQALAIFTAIGDSLGRANIFWGLGRIHRAQSNYSNAEDHLRQALTIYDSIGHSPGRANAFCDLGTTHKARVNYPEAEEAFNQALIIYTTIGSSWGRTHALIGLSEALLPQGRYSEAKSLLNDAAEVSNYIGYKWAQDQSRKLLAEASEMEKSATEARP